MYKSNGLLINGENLIFNKIVMENVNISDTL